MYKRSPEQPDNVPGNPGRFNEEYQPEVQEDDPEEMEGAEHPHKENTGGNQHHDSDNETGETADHSIK
ncbi:hypothetical protein BON89_25705, partial [Escherichia coli]